MSDDPLSATLFALADPTRRGILARLARGDASVNDLAEPYDMSRAAVSKHLKVLERAGLISRGKDAQWRPCHLEGAPLRAVSEWLDDYRRFWDRSLEALTDYLEDLVAKRRGLRNGELEGRSPSNEKGMQRPKKKGRRR